MNRRALITAAPVVGFAALVASSAEPAEVGSPIADMHREIMRLHGVANDPSLSDQESEAACNHMVALADEIVDLPAQSLADMLLKFMGHTVNGEHGTNECPRSDELWAEARALVA